MNKSKANNKEVLNQDTEPKNDMVNHPDHYTFGRVETIDYIEDCLGRFGEIDYCLGNCIKYISRAKHKGKYLEDLKKAQWYLNRVMSVIESDEYLNELFIAEERISKK